MRERERKGGREGKKRVLGSLVWQNSEVCHVLLTVMVK